MLQIYENAVFLRHWAATDRTDGCSLEAIRQNRSTDDRDDLSHFGRYLLYRVLVDLGSTRVTLRIETDTVYVEYPAIL